LMFALALQNIYQITFMSYFGTAAIDRFFFISLENFKKSITYRKKENRK
jgi:hypothetical protein